MYYVCTHVLLIFSPPSTISLWHNLSLSLTLFRSHPLSPHSQEPGGQTPGKRSGQATPPVCVCARACACVLCDLYECVCVHVHFLSLTHSLLLLSLTHSLTHSLPLQLSLSLALALTHTLSHSLTLSLSLSLTHTASRWQPPCGLSLSRFRPPPNPRRRA